MPTQSSPRWLNPVEMTAWRQLVDLMGALNHDLESELVSAHNLTIGDYQVLVVLSEQPEHEMRMCDLSALLGLSPSGLTRRLDGLVARGLVERRPDVGDRRVILAVLTPEGFSTLGAAAPDHVEGVRRHFLDHLSERQVATLAKILTTVVTARTQSTGLND